MKCVVYSTKHRSEFRVFINQSFSVKCVVDSTKHWSEVRVDQSVDFCVVCCRFYKAPELGSC